jgi:thiosulfate reductase cytochrome b subunit
MRRGIGSHPAWLRWWHWSNAVLFGALLITGLSMHYSRAAVGFRMTVLIHNSAGILLTVCYGVFFAGNILWGNGRYYRLVAGDLSIGLLRQARHYLLGIFLGEPAPFPHTEERKFNPLQKLSYLFVMSVPVPLLIVTGWVLLFPGRLPNEMFGIPGIAIWAIAHAALGFLLSLFTVVHVYLGTTGATPGELFRLMLTGDEIAGPDGRASAPRSDTPR